MFTDTEIQMKVWSMDKLTKNFNHYIIITVMIFHFNNNIKRKWIKVV